MHRILLIILCLGLLGCSNSNSTRHYYKTNKQYRLEEEIDALYDENSELEDQVNDLEDESFSRDVNNGKPSGYYSEYDHLSNDDIRYEIDDRQDQIYDNEMEIIDKEYELDMTYID